ncbi:endonuclease/exonuclease/phosphatase family protein [Candidatus Albibeggiatoa sp. nov. NOAA]|uniref:endonuclease/exonuclease/phosphatase family protein n=1 Tax=Candidatus Albibeggiatoa sp. nov. NOAA TaxID=3162724 RepID=UPI003300DDC4|nr:endonuclease/exonuclease/phosphatase family protein [Thiotrichaceae bacterium]
MTHYPSNKYRFATFNTALSRQHAGELISDLFNKNNGQARAIAEIIQRTQPHVLVLQEFDYDLQGTALSLFKKNYLDVSQNGAQSIDYPYAYLVSSNAGTLSGMDLDNDGSIHSPGDAFGFGFFEGQYASVVLSQYPIKVNEIRTFQHFLWKDMPDAKLPIHPVTGDAWYSDEKLDIMRLSSKNHVDIPIEFPEATVHILSAHPTPPTFDGREKRNALRNHDEIRLLADYIQPETSGYIYDDNGQVGGLQHDDYFVIMGDLNADPKYGDSVYNAIGQLLQHPKIHPDIQTGRCRPFSKGGEECKTRAAQAATASWGLQVDYVLPSRNMKIWDSRVFWPVKADPLAYLVKQVETYRNVKKDISSDHRLVWLDACLS